MAVQFERVFGGAVGHGLHITMTEGGDVAQVELKFEDPDPVKTFQSGIPRNLGYDYYWTRNPGIWRYSADISVFGAGLWRYAGSDPLETAKANSNDENHGWVDDVFSFDGGRALSRNRTYRAIRFIKDAADTVRDVTVWTWFKLADDAFKEIT